MATHRVISVSEQNYEELSAIAGELQARYKCHVSYCDVITWLVQHRPKVQDPAQPEPRLKRAH